VVCIYDYVRSVTKFSYNINQIVWGSRVCLSASRFQRVSTKFRISCFGKYQFVS
jgi:hypothetical protein